MIRNRVASESFCTARALWCNRIGDWDKDATPSRKSDWDPEMMVNIFDNTWVGSKSSTKFGSMIQFMDIHESQADSGWKYPQYESNLLLDFEISKITSYSLVFRFFKENKFPRELIELQASLSARLLFLFSWFSLTISYFSMLDS